MPDAGMPTLDGDLSGAKIDELLSIGCELPELDYKQSLALNETRDLVELAKDVGAMQVRGGYIVIGVDGAGKPTGRLDHADTRALDEANLTSRLRKYLPPPLMLRARLAERDGHRIAILFVAAHPSGCAFFTGDGRYRDGDREVLVFRAGDVYWRDGTRSVRMSQDGFELVVQRRVDLARAEWLTREVEPTLAGMLRKFLIEGRRVRTSASPSLDGSCALYEIWEHQLRTALQDRDRHDLVAELTADVRLDALRGLWSDRWRAQRRFDRMLNLLVGLVNRLKAPEQTAA